MGVKPIDEEKGYPPLGREAPKQLDVERQNVISWLITKLLMDMWQVMLKNPTLLGQRKVTTEDVNRATLSATKLLDILNDIVDILPEDEIDLVKILYNINKSIVPLTSLKTFGLEPLIDNEVEVSFWKTVGEGYTVRIPVKPDAEQLVKNLIASEAGFIVRETPNGYILDKVKVTDVVGQMVYINRDSWEFDYTDTEPELVTNDDEWEFLDAIWEEFKTL
jgi:hypothetical protein